jgi:signal transduction histidine kinase
MINLFVIIQNLEKPTSSESERYMLVYMLGVLILLCTLVILFFIVFQKRKNKLILDKIAQQQAFEEELSKTQLEIQEQTLKNIGQELHDNVGQLLSVANMNLSILSMQISDDIKESFIETKDAVKESLSELRALSKSLNSDVIVNKGLQQSIENEVRRLNKLKLLKTTLDIKGNPEDYKDSKNSIILFRIIQEFISNTVKYSKATLLEIILNYKTDAIEIIAIDNGKGFNMVEVEKGAGLLNMKNRATLINAGYNLSSNIGEGVKLELNYDYN